MSGNSGRSIGPWLPAIAAVAVIAILIGGGITAAVYWKREPTPEPKRTPFEGRLTVGISKVSSKPRKVVLVADPLALPVKAGDAMFLEAEYAEPAHTFIIW